MKTAFHSVWSRFAAIAVAMLFALGFAAMQTSGTSDEEDGAALSKAAGQSSEFVMSEGAVPDSDTASAASAAIARASASATIVAGARKN